MATAVPYFPPTELKAGFAPDPHTQQNDWIRGTTKLSERVFEETGFVDQRPDYEVPREAM